MPIEVIVPKSKSKAEVGPAAILGDKQATLNLEARALLELENNEILRVAIDRDRGEHGIVLLVVPPDNDVSGASPVRFRSTTTTLRGLREGMEALGREKGAWYRVAAGDAELIPGVGKVIGFITEQIVERQ